SSATDMFWLWAAVTLLLTAGLGFFAGAYYARAAPRWALQRARKDLAQLFQLATESLASAQQVCGLLEQFPSLLLSAQQLERLELGRAGLSDVLSSVVERHRLDDETVNVQLYAQRPPIEPPPTSWVRTPEDPSTRLPNRTAFETNLADLLDWGSRTGQES